MRSFKKTSWLVFGAFVLVPAAVVTACGDDDDDGGDRSTPIVLDGSPGAETSAKSDGQVSTEGGPTDGSTADVTHPEAGNDSGTDSGVDAGDAGKDSGTDSGVDSGTDSGTDAGADAGDAGDAGPKPSSLDNAAYKITAWTCTGGGNPDVNVLTVAGTSPGPGIAEVDLTVNGTVANPLDVSFKGGDCKKTNQVAITYPQAGVVTTSSGIAHTCTGTCSAAQCPVANDPVLTDTFDFTKAALAFTAQRAFPAGKGATLAGFAGCKEGQTESVTYTKK